MAAMTSSNGALAGASWRSRHQSEMSRTYAVEELLLFITSKLPKNARGEWGLRQKDRGGALEDRNHWVVVRDGVVREDRRIQKGKRGALGEGTQRCNPALLRCPSGRLRSGCTA